MLSYFDGRNITLAVTACFAIVAGGYILWGPSQKKKRDRKGKCPGLVNLGNSCFLNAVLQALATCPSLNKWLSTVLLKCGDGHQSKILIPALQSVLRVLNNAEDAGVYSGEYCPTEVLEALQARRWVISSDQQDAHELFHVLTETLDEESTKYPAVISLFDIVQLLESEHQDKETAVNCIKTELPVLPARDTDSPFRGLLASQLKCTRCYYKYPVKYDTFDSLSLTLPPAAHPMLGVMSIEGLLERFARPESVYDVECTGCAKKMKLKAGAPLPKATFVKKLTIGKLPRCLCLHVQRTVWRNDGLPMKRPDHVTFSECLDMEPYVYHKRKQLEKYLKVATLPGLLGGKCSTEPSPTTPAKEVKKCVFSPSVQTPYPYPLNLLKALHYSKVQSPKRGLYLDTTPLCCDAPQYKNCVSSYHHYRPPPPQQHQTTTSLADSQHLDKMARSFTFEQILIDSDKDKTSDKYKLCAVVEHRGDVFSGHFVTYRQAVQTEGSKPSNHGNGTTKWLYTSDTTVKSVKFSTVLGVDAYMLYYEKT